MTIRHPQLDVVETVPYHRWLGIASIVAEAGQASFNLPVAEHCANTFGVLHGGIIASCCDIVAYCALVSALPHDTLAVTHGFNLSIMRPTSVGVRLRFEGRVIRKGRNVAFLDAKVLDGENIVATAQVTKSLMKAKG
ncbi:MAG: hypothetical protein RL385_3668 [Pseudomonadota bacterium]